MKPVHAAVLAALLLAAVPAGAQNGSSAAPTPITPPKTETPPATTPPATSPPPATTPPEPEQVPAPPPPQPAPIQPMSIQPDQAYPNGFQDPDDPFANEMRAYREEQQGFPWGLLGLLGLLGLIPLIRGNGNVRTVYVEREEPRRVVRREERIDD